MVRPEDPEKLSAIVVAAAEMYARYGFKRTQMVDVAEEVGVALGTVYRYAKSKEALFDAALRHAFGASEGEIRKRLRGERPSRRAIVNYVQRFARDADLFPVLDGILLTRSSDEPREELCAVVGELYDVLDRYSLAICIVEQSACEWPELAKTFVGDMRGPLVERLYRYVVSRCDAGKFQQPPDCVAATHFVLELCAEFTRGRTRSPTGDNYVSDAIARETVLFFVCRGMLRESQAPLLTANNAPDLKEIC